MSTVRDSDGARGSSSGAHFARVLPLDADALIDALLHLDASRGAAILDSGGAHEPSGARFLIAGFDPFEIVEARGRELRVWSRDGDSTRVEKASVLDYLDARLDGLRTPKPHELAHLPAAAGCIVTLSYELARDFQSPRAFARELDARRGPDAVLSFFDTLVIHDYARGETTVTSATNSPARLKETCDELEGAARERPKKSRSSARSPSPESLASNFTREEYLASVASIREHIYAGDIYQANLTQQLTRPLGGATPDDIFLRLRREHPAPFAAFLRQRERTIVSASPERFLRVEVLEEDEGGRRVEAWPIKGTRPRGASAEEDARLRAELLASGKDRAENVMIVDLLRNDLGRVCRYGSIEVAEVCALQEHPTLFHLVSKVRGLLRADVSAGDLLRATFPCGSITGAPKIRAMRIIDELETAPRGVSMGAIGYLSFDGALDLNVAIRTMTIDTGCTARFNVGGGVVAESDPALEYEESLVKARALLRALGVSA